MVSRATHTGLTWEAVTALTDDQLEQTLWGPKLPLTATRSLPDPLRVHTELRGHGVTLELLHLEYLAERPDGLRYSAFCAHYRRWVALQRCSMRQVHKAGEKLFVDYAGQRPHLVDPRTGEIVPVELFVAVLGASNYTYAEATLSQRIPDLLASHTRALDYLGGVTTMVVPDRPPTDNRLTPASLRSDHDGVDWVITMRWNSRSPCGGITDQDAWNTQTAAQTHA